MTVLEVIEEFWREQEYKPRMIMERNASGEVVGHIDEKGWSPNYIEDRRGFHHLGCGCGCNDHLK